MRHISLDTTAIVIAVVVMTLTITITTPLAEAQSGNIPSASNAATNTPMDSAAIAALPEITTLEQVLKTPKSVYKLNLQSSGLLDFPTEILRCMNVQVLDLSRNGLMEVPGDITTLKDLRRLILSVNGLRKLPSNIGELKKLQFLDISQNQFTVAELERLHKVLPQTQIVD